MAGRSPRCQAASKRSMISSRRGPAGGGGPGGGGGGAGAGLPASREARDVLGGGGVGCGGTRGGGWVGGGHRRFSGEDGRRESIMGVSPRGRRPAATIPGRRLRTPAAPARRRPQ